MSVVDTLFHGWGRRKLNKLVMQHNRQRQVYNFSDANTIGIVFQADDEDRYRDVKDYVHQLREEGFKTIMALGYYKGKTLPEHLHTKLELDYFTRRDVKTFFRPTGKVVNNFVNEHYDILIDLSDPISLPLDWILGLSKARFKVGRYNKEREHFYDMMLHVNENEGLKFYLSQLNHYLSIINLPEEKQLEHVEQV